MWQDNLIGGAIFVNMCLNKVNPSLLGAQHLIRLVWKRCIVTWTDLSTTMATATSTE